MNDVTIRKEMIDRKGRVNSDHQRAVIYLDKNPLNDILDEFYVKNDIFDMKVKSKAWSKLVRFSSSIVERKLAKYFGVDPKFVKFSFNAGCSCGCSPGYILKKPAPFMQFGYPKKDIWCEVNITEEDMNSLKVFMSSQKIQKLLEQDIAADKAKKEAKH